MWAEKPGTRPRAVGPRRMPPITSAITFGWRMRERGQPRRRVKIMIMLHWRRSRVSKSQDIGYQVWRGGTQGRG